MKKILFGLACFCNLSAMILPEPGDQGQPLVTTIVVKLFEFGKCTRSEEVVVPVQVIRSRNEQVAGFVQSTGRCKGCGAGELNLSQYHLPEPIKPKEDITQ